MKMQMKTWMVVMVTIITAVIALVFWLHIDDLGDVLAAQQGNTVVSLELAFAPVRAADMVDGWQEAKLIGIARKSVHWDWLLIASYFVSMLFLREWIGRVKDTSCPQWALSWLLFLPIFIAGLDVLENIGLYILLSLGSTKGFLFALIVPIVGALAAFKFIFLFIFLVVVWRTVRVNLKILFMPRFSLLMLAVGSIAIFVPQFQEALTAVVENGGFWLSFWLGLTTFIASVTTWYSARVLYRLKLVSAEGKQEDEEGKPKTVQGKFARLKQMKVGIHNVLTPLDARPVAEEAEKRDTAPVLKTWYPRVLGFLVPLITVVGLFIALEWEFSFKLLTPLISLMIAWVLYTLFVIFRRQMFKLEKKHEKEFGLYDGIFDPEMPWSSKGILLVLLLINLLAFLSVLVDPLWVQGAGSAAVVIGAIGLLVPVGTGVVYYGERWGLPLLLLAIILAGLFSFHNDNHWVRLKSDASSSNSSQERGKFHKNNGVYENLRSYTTAWVDARKGSEDQITDIPLFIVSTEGGGIRAAYWTAIVLANLQDQGEGFADYLFAVSGVSGGSLGGTVFVAQVTAGIPAGVGSYLTHADTVLQEDFLSPAMAALLYPDLVQRFLPWAIFDDRAIALERSWEEAWKDSWPPGKEEDGHVDQNLSKDRFKLPFDQLWTRTDDGTPVKWVPLLFLNSTVVETGNRFIIHPLAFDDGNSETKYADSKERFVDIFKDAVDGRVALGGTVPVSTAVHLSARFTYVSPAGSVQNASNTGMDADGKNHRWIRLVDGGYFENSATITAQELLNALERYRKEAPSDHPLKRIKPFMIHISNDPVRYPPDVIRKQRGKQAAFGEIISPLLALLHTRPARGFQARDELIAQMGKHQAHFQLYDLGTTLPLGWVLSAKARQNMQEQLGLEKLDTDKACEDLPTELRSRCEEDDNFKQWIEDAKKHNQIQRRLVLMHLRMK